MSNSKLIADWNDIFDYKLAESDLQRPTEGFVFNVLLEYLRKTHVDVAPLINSANSANRDARRMSKINFCAYIDHLYKISCADNCFVYFDLIKPSPKKTAHMLKVLLNYYLYFEMLRKETVTFAEAKLQERNRVSDKHTNYQLEIETSKLKLEEAKKKIIQNQNTLPKLEDEIQLYAAKEKTQTDKLTQIQDTIRSYEAILAQLKFKEESLRCDIVSEKEIETLVANKEILEQAISEQDDTEKATLANSEDLSKVIKEKQGAVDKIQLVMNEYPVDIVNPLKEMKPKLQQNMQQYAKKNSENEELSRTIQNQRRHLADYEKEYALKKQFLNTIRKQAEEQILAIQRKIEIQQQSWERFNSKLQNCKKLLEEENQTGEMLLKTAQKLAAELSALL